MFWVFSLEKDPLRFVRLFVDRPTVPCEKRRPRPRTAGGEEALALPRRCRDHATASELVLNYETRLGPFVQILRMQMSRKDTWSLPQLSFRQLFGESGAPRTSFRSTYQQLNRSAPAFCRLNLRPWFPTDFPNSVQSRVMTMIRTCTSLHHCSRLMHVNGGYGLLAMQCGNWASQAQSLAQLLSRKHPESSG